ncbi:MAG: NAD(P)/FAD-dependent oxidoreductase [Myxococcales bacterium]|nr:NAD(P)/FAD-dependent oxidoreductase [Myxococcota bacterium]MDW8280941.1 NAD(P)/FAD-dependent oxidoreductase [Myxococcales bacterium]
MGELPLRAVVIGSGIGGSAAALLLQHAGVPTTLVEKNRRIGGSCSAYEKQGFQIDIGTHMFCRGPRGPLGAVLRRVGREGEIRFRRTRDIAEMRVVTQRPGSPQQELVCVPIPSEMHRMPRFLWDLGRALRLPPREVIRALRMLARALSMGEAELRRWDGRTVEEFVQRYTHHGPTLGVFGFLLGLYFILPYWEVSAGEALWCFQRMVRDGWLSYPLGGSIAVPGTYCRIARELGAVVRTGTGVRRILVESGSVRGVELTDGTVLPARIVVSTSSLRTTVLHLVGAQHFPTDYVDRARSVRGSYIAVQAKIGLRRPLVSAGALVGGVGEDIDLFRLSPGDLKEMFGALLQGRIPPVVPFYGPVPTNFDPTLAPPGCQLITVCAVAPTSDVALHDPAPAWEEAMLRALRRVVPGLEDNLLFVDRFSVDFIEKWIGKEFGPAVSTAQTPDQVGARRPTVYTPVRGLYLAGCNAGGRGVGTELAAASAMECVDRILADLGQPSLPAAHPALG